MRGWGRYLWLLCKTNYTYRTSQLTSQNDIWFRYSLVILRLVVLFSLEQRQFARSAWADWLALELTIILGKRYISYTIEGFRGKRAYIAFLADFHFLQDQANFWQTDLFWQEKHRSVIILYTNVKCFSLALPAWYNPFLSSDSRVRYHALVLKGW